LKNEIGGEKMPRLPHEEILERLDRIEETLRRIEDKLR